MTSKGLDTTPASSVYQPLDQDRQEIRVLTVEPGQDDDEDPEWSDELICSLSIVSLADDPIPLYETISYTWGDASVRDSITLNGMELDVPASSAAAIRRMRLPDKPRVLWIDAICINQRGLEEKAWQTAFMGSVYANGAGNLIYLGQDETGSGLMAVAILERLVKEIQGKALLLTGRDLERWERHFMPLCWVKTDDFTVTEKEQDILERLCSAQWFTRLWVVQEFALARNNTCHWGSECFSLSDVLLVAYVVMLTASYQELGAGIGNATSVWFFLDLTTRTKQRKGQLLTWVDLYHVAIRLSTTERRDHIFALSGLVQACQNPGRSLPSLLRPDYSSKTVDEVFRDATRHVLESDGDYLLKQIVRESEHDMTQRNRASWCLPWDYKTSPLIETSKAGWLRGTTYGQQGLKISAKSNANLLRVRVLRLGTVDEDVQVVKQLASDVYNLARHRLEYSTSEEVGECAAFLLACGQLEYLSLRFDSPTQLTEGFTDILNLALAEEEAALGELGSRFHVLITRTANDRTFFGTDTGHMGSGPKLTRKGDVAFIMLGGDLVHVLRPVDDYYLYVGATYVHGMMEGEVFDLGLDPEWVDIR